MDRVLWLSGHVVGLVGFRIFIREFSEFVRHAPKEIKDILFGIDRENESGCGAKAIVFGVEAADFLWSNVAHFVWDSSTVEGKRVCVAEHTFIEFKIISV